MQSSFCTQISPGPLVPAATHIPWRSLQFTKQVWLAEQVSVGLAGSQPGNVIALRPMSAIPPSIAAGQVVVCLNVTSTEETSPFLIEVVADPRPRQAPPEPTTPTSRKTAPD